MTRSAAITSAAEYFDSGDFLMDLTRRVAFRTESGVADHRPDVFAYLQHEMVPAANRLGADARVLDNPAVGGGPLLLAERHEDPSLPTVLTYGHADVVPAEPLRWRAGISAKRLPYDSTLMGAFAAEPPLPVNQSCDAVKVGRSSGLASGFQRATNACLLFVAGVSSLMEAL